MDAPLREVGGDLVPVQSPLGASSPAVPSSPQVLPPPAPKVPAEPAARPAGGAESSRAKRRKPLRADEPTARLAAAPPAPEIPPLAEPTPSPQETNPTLGESATQFARGFAKGVSDEGRQIYQDTKELPSQLAKTGREILEDIHANRRVRALAPLVALEHAVRNASRDDVTRVAQGVIVAAKEWLEKPAYEKGESLGRTTTAIASEVAIDVLTEGIGSVATLRKVGKVAEAADHVRDAEKVADRAAHNESHGLHFAKKSIEREAKEAEAALKGNQNFRRWFHREYKSDQVLPKGGRTNPDMSSQQVRDAYLEWLETGKPKVK
jgi:hypothetical protein